jgi:predicted ATPase
VTFLAINRLGERDIGAMIDGVVGNKPLPANIRHEIIERTDGIPLFVEEMTKAVLEAASESAVKQTAATVTSPGLAVPASLHASLMARLDRLGAAKAVAQIGAAIGREFSHALLSAVEDKPGPELALALDGLIHAGLLFRQGVPPHATYLFKHALVQDAAYGTLLREPRRALHARIAQALESQFAEIAENQPELIARHCSEAGLTEKAAILWGKAGQRSLERSAFLEAIEQFTRALGQIAALAATPAIRREEIKLQVALITPLIHVKGYAAPETRAAAERARLLIEQAGALGEPPEDPLLLFTVLYSFWVADFVRFNGDAMRELAAKFLTLAGKQGASVPLMIGHRLMGSSLMCTGSIAEGRSHYDQALALYDPAEHRSLAIRFGQDIRMAILSYRSQALWLLGYPEAALADTKNALGDAREIGHAATLMYALNMATFTTIYCGDYVAAEKYSDELIALGHERATPIWKALGLMHQGLVLSLTGRASEAVPKITSGLDAFRSTGATQFTPLYLSYLAKSHAELGQFDYAWRCVGDATNHLKSTKETWHDAECHRIAGEVALMLPEDDTAKAEVYFEQALAIACQQQARSFELRAAMSLARLWRDQGKPQQARELLAPVYGWFTEGFDTRDLKEAKALLQELAA